MDEALARPTARRTRSAPGLDVTALAHDWIAPALGPGAIALDATAGTGRDTLFLARRVGPAGRVHAFDIQSLAIRRSRERLAAAGLARAVHWHRQCHSQAPDWLAPGVASAAMFNLGWLPGGDRAIVTRPATTVAALAACSALLRPGGRLSVVCYLGHAGGTEEEAAVAAWVARGAGRLRLVLGRHASAARHGPVVRLLEQAPPTR